MSDVWAYHAGLDRYVEVAESAIPQMAMSGWVQQDPPPPPTEDELEALVERAAELGVKVDGRWGTERLAAEVAAAEAAQAQPDPSPAPAEAPEE